jgi:hypothetical protein
MTSFIRQLRNVGDRVELVEERLSRPRRLARSSGSSTLTITSSKNGRPRLRTEASAFSASA